MRLGIGLFIGFFLGDIEIDQRRIRLGTFLELISDRAQHAVKIVDPLAMLGGKAQGFAQTKAPCLNRAAIPGFAFGLVHAQNHARILFAQDIGKNLIRGGDANAAIHQEQADIRHFNGALGQAAHPALKAVIGDILQPGGVDHRKAQVENLAIALAQVAGDARLVIDKRQLATNEPVEQRGFADIGSTDYGECKAHLCPPGAVRIIKSAALHGLGVNGKREVAHCRKRHKEHRPPAPAKRRPRPAYQP